MKKIGTAVLLYFLILFFGMSIALLFTVATSLEVTMDNTVEFSGTVDEVKIFRARNDTIYEIELVEYGPELSFFVPSDSPHLSSLKSGAKITFRVSDDDAGYLTTYPADAFTKIKVISLSTEEGIVRSLEDYRQSEKTHNMQLLMTVILMVIILGMGIAACIKRLRRLTKEEKLPRPR